MPFWNVRNRYSSANLMCAEHEKVRQCPRYSDRGHYRPCRDGFTVAPTALGRSGPFGASVASPRLEARLKNIKDRLLLIIIVGFACIPAVNFRYFDTSAAELLPVPSLREYAVSCPVVSWRHVRICKFEDVAGVEVKMNGKVRKWDGF